MAATVGQQRARAREKRATQRRVRATREYRSVRGDTITLAPDGCCYLRLSGHLGSYVSRGQAAIALRILRSVTTVRRSRGRASV